MHPRLRPLACAVLGALTTAAARGAAAQGWAQLPNGNWGYTLDLASAGTFRCLSVALLPPGTSCAAAGNAITLGNAGATLTMTFTGTTQTVTATTVGARVGPVGTITKAFGGSGPFSFPLQTNPNVFLLGLTVRLETTSPLPSAGAVEAFYQRVSPAQLTGGGSRYVVFPVTPHPTGLRYPNVVLDGFVPPAITLDASAVVFPGLQIGVVPEPAPLALVAAGAAGLAAAAARRRRA
jgi:hypothetical protein